MNLVKISLFFVICAINGHLLSTENSPIAMSSSLKPETYFKQDVNQDNFRLEGQLKIEQDEQNILQRQHPLAEILAFAQVESWGMHVTQSREKYVTTDHPSRCTYYVEGHEKREGDSSWSPALYWFPNCNQFMYTNIPQTMSRDAILLLQKKYFKEPGVTTVKKKDKLEINVNNNKNGTAIAKRLQEAASQPEEQEITDGVVTCKRTSWLYNPLDRHRYKFKCEVTNRAHFELLQQQKLQTVQELLQQQKIDLKEIRPELEKDAFKD